MKKLLLIIPIIILIAGACSKQAQVQPIKNQGTQTSDETTNWKTYTSSEFGFSFKYPNEGHFSSGVNGVEIKKSQLLETKVGSSLASYSNTFLPNMPKPDHVLLRSFSVVAIPQPFVYENGPGKYTTDSKIYTNLEDAVYNYTLHTSGPGAASSTNFTHGNIDGVETSEHIAQKSTWGDKDGLTVYILKDNILYNFRMGPTDDPIIQAMYSSIKFTKIN